MTTSPRPAAPLRQWRVTITEDLHHGQRTACLSWRTFPCRADKWDGHQWYTFPSAMALPVTSQEALRDLLADLAAEPWHEGRYPRRDRP